MQTPTPEQRLQMVEIDFQNSRSVRQTYRAFHQVYGTDNRPSEQLIRNIMDRLMTTYTLLDNIHINRAHTVRKDATDASVTENSNLLNLSPLLAIQSLLLHYLENFEERSWPTYKIQLVQELNPTDLQSCCVFGELAENQLEVKPDFYRQIIFSDESHFSLNGHHYIPKETLFGLHAEGVIGRFVFKSETSTNIAVNGERYRQMIRDFFFPHVIVNHQEEKWFQQDGAKCHTARENITFFIPQSRICCKTNYSFKRLGRETVDVAMLKFDIA